MQGIKDVGYGMLVASVKDPNGATVGYGNRRRARATAHLSCHPKSSMDTMNKKADKKPEKTPSQLISERIAELGDWRGATLHHVRKLIKDADPEVIEEWKWRGVPVWSHNGGICTGESYKDHVKLTFYKGASLRDPKHLFNQDGTVRRAIDIHKGDEINEPAFKNLVRAAVTLNSSGKKKR